MRTGNNLHTKWIILRVLLLALLPSEALIRMRTNGNKNMNTQTKTQRMSNIDIVDVNCGGKKAPQVLDKCS